MVPHVVVVVSAILLVVTRVSSQQGSCKVELRCVDSTSWELITCSSPFAVPGKRTGKCIPPSFCEYSTGMCSQPGAPATGCVFEQVCRDAQTSLLTVCPPSGPDTTATTCAPGHSCKYESGICTPNY